MGVDMAKKMRTDEGKLKPFSEWKKDIKSIASHYCGAWLQTEYNTATLRAKFAAEWKQYEADVDIMPNLRWMPTTSANPEEEHKVYWMNRLTLSVGDKFWDKHHPGDHWNCKCSLEQTDEPANPDVLSHIPDVKPQKGLAANPGKTGEMFDQQHPYFAKSCAKCFATKGLKNKMTSFLNIKRDCMHCEYINNCLKPSLNYKIGKGHVKIHPLVEVTDTDFKKLQQVAEYFASKGHTVELTPKMSRPSKFDYDCVYHSLVGTKFEGKCPDLRIDGVWYEHEGFVTDNPKRAFKNMLNDGMVQSSRLIIDRPNLTTRWMKHNIFDRVTRYGQDIQEVWIRNDNGGLELLYKNSGSK
jgi:hypothetical protein